MSAAAEALLEGEDDRDPAGQRRLAVSGQRLEPRGKCRPIAPPQQGTLGVQAKDCAGGCQVLRAVARRTRS